MVELRRAATAEGYELPVIDITHPAFALADDLDAIAALREAQLEAEAERSRVPKFLMDFFLALAARRSLLVRALTEPDADYLGGLSTYAMKLGPDNLVPPFDRKIDRQLAAAPAATSMRIRLQQTARLIAEGLSADLAARPGLPLHLINIGGGPAIDSLNALILLRRADPGLPARPITIHVLDLDAAGPFFGANALAALAVAGGPLAGLQASLLHRAYRWDDTRPLEKLVAKLAAKPAIIAASSEGALFDYGSDAAIVANLRALRAHGRGACLVAGSVTRTDEISRRVLAGSRFKLVPRSIAALGALAAAAGFAIARVEEALISDQVLLRQEDEA